MEKTKAALKVVLADSFVMYFRTHSYHWNVEGSNFGEMHEFFGDIYEDLHGTIDTWAEQIRTLDEYAPASLMELYNYKNIHEDPAKPSTLKDMLTNTQSSNNIMIANLDVLFQVATDENLQNIADVAAARLDAHRKLAWMLKSYLKA